ncbi:MAG: rod shape-determining protein MreC, partial [archaeon]|nr:rod shape-determining protein MreC [archaeon]
DVIGAEIVGKNLFEDVITIKIKKAEAEVGDSVITSGKVLVGRIIEVGAEIARVQLISHTQSSFDAKIETKDIIGVLKGEGNGTLFFDLVAQDKELREGDVVTTSKLGGIFPANLLIGEVATVEQVDVETFQKATVSPFFELSSAKLLFVITSDI